VNRRDAHHAVPIEEWADLHGHTIEADPDMTEYCRKHPTVEMAPLGDGCDECNAGPTDRERAQRRHDEAAAHAARMDVLYDARMTDAMRHDDY